MISAPDRIQAVQLINETVTAGAGLKAACEEIGLTDRTYFRWKKLLGQIGSYDDLRPTAVHPTPANKLTVEEEQQILEIIKQSEFVDLPRNCPDSC